MPGIPHLCVYVCVGHDARKVIAREQEDLGEKLKWEEKES